MTTAEKHIPNDDELQQGPVQEKKKEKESPPPDKPYDEMTEDELRERATFERTWRLENNFGISKEKIDRWKGAHGRVGSVMAGDDVYIYRGLRRFEKRTLVKKSGAHPEIWRRELDFTEEVVKQCLLHPDLELTYIRTEMPDGVVETVAQSILTLSGHGAEVTAVEL